MSLELCAEDSQIHANDRNTCRCFRDMWGLKITSWRQRIIMYRYKCTCSAIGTDVSEIRLDLQICACGQGYLSKCKDKGPRDTCTKSGICVGFSCAF